MVKYVQTVEYNKTNYEMYNAVILIVDRIVYGVFFLLNLVFWAKGSSAAILFSTLIALLALRFGISVPLVFVGVTSDTRRMYVYQR